MDRNMILRAGLYMVCTLGVTVGLRLMIDGLDSDEFVAIWLAFWALMAGTDYVQREFAKPDPEPNLMDLFERIEQ